MEQDKVLKEELLALTVEIVASHVSNNSVAVDELPNLIGQIFTTLRDLGNKGTIAEQAPEPVVPIKKSITPDYLICLEDGKKLKMLKRHLKTRYDMSPDDYRARWNLPADYPMVAPNYAKQRRDLAKKIGLGRGKKR
ncbi:MucR family transcriptional regulator [Kordiimonas aestuarii]|uniref:MucR family transcriptional regulator n=1 Tax=Kordiimonas aestuarii TaxID=1005925 RepID=UPI0021D0B4FC|nr:MucR family transcriptional regulator [Kordiimonas aestuarii]